MQLEELVQIASRVICEMEVVSVPILQQRLGIPLYQASNLMYELLAVGVINPTYGEDCPHKDQEQPKRVLPALMEIAFPWKGSRFSKPLIDPGFFRDLRQCLKVSLYSTLSEGWRIAYDLDSEEGIERAKHLSSAFASLVYQLEKMKLDGIQKIQAAEAAFNQLKPRRANLVGQGGISEQAIREQREVFDIALAEFASNLDLHIGTWKRWYKAMMSQRGFSLEGFVGQEEIKQKIRFEIELASKKADRLNHILIRGRAGEGKGRLAYCIAGEMGVEIRELAADSIKNSRELLLVLVELSARSVLLVKNMERINPRVAETLHQAMIGEDPHFRLGQERATVAIPRFSLIGTIPTQSKLREPLASAFHLSLIFSKYGVAELSSIIQNVVSLQKMDIDVDCATEIARRADGSVRSSLLLLEEARNYSLVRGYAQLTPQVVFEAFGLPATLPLVSADRTGRSFEVKCLELLRRKGFEVELTRPTADGGIDINATFRHGITSSKIIVQCKDWTKPVGSPVVREFFGTICDADADRGILIVSSSFTQDAFDFAAGKRLELIDGRALGMLLAES